MNFTIPNIYKNSNLKFFVAIPVVLMLIGIYLSQGLVLDSSLAGGVSITVQATTASTASQIASAISSKLHTPSPSVQVSSGTVQITIASNKSLSNAESDLIALYQYNANYSADILNQTNYRIILQKTPNNQTISSLLQKSIANQNSSIVGMNKYLNMELAVLRPFNVGVQSANGTAGIVDAAQKAYTNASAVYQQQVLTAISQVIPYKSYSYQQITVLQSSYFIQQLKNIIIAAFILISIVVFFIFRTAVPSFAVVFGAANDMIVALGAMALFKIPLGIASIGGLLMLLGYSIDTDVLTAIRIIKRHEGTPEDRAYGSMVTGLTMTTTAIVSFAVLFAISYLAYVPTYFEISGVVLFGLIGDLFTTWLGNASIILMYVKRKEGA